jgi:purine-binding chemotaxis protein CheW
MISAFLRFRVGEQWYGINVGNVAEVLPLMMFNDVPGSSPDMLGLITLRDQVVPILDLRIRFGLDAAEFFIDTPILALRTPQGIVGVVVDEADAVVVASDDQIIPQTDRQIPYISAIIKHPERMLLLLDENLQVDAKTEISNK